jgi:hypothetical protein
MPKAQSEIGGDQTVEQGDRPPAAFDARHLEVDPAATPRSDHMHGGEPLDG